MGITLCISYFIIGLVFISVYFMNKDKWKIAWILIGIALALSMFFAFGIPYLCVRGFI
jgi:uncharacterized membrane protein